MHIPKLVTLFITISVTFLFSGCMDFHTCGDTLIQEKLSPDTKYKTVFYIRDCGATTDFSTQIKIIGDDREKIIFVAEGEYKDIKIEWKNNNQILINYSGDLHKIFQFQNQWRDIEVNLYQNGKNINKP